MRTKFPIYGRGRELQRVRTEFGITEAAKTGIKAPSFAVTNKILPDGTLVKLTTIAQFATPSVVPPAGSPMQPSLRKAQVILAPEVSTSVQCSFLSGFFNLINSLNILEDGYFSQVAFKAAGGFVNSEDMTGSFKNFGITSSACSIFRYKPSSIVSNLGSSYTGIMRKVVQTIAGMNYPIPYSYCYTTTDGIFVGTDGSHHVVRIDTSRGVLTQPVPKCKDLDAEEKSLLGIDLDYIPSPILDNWRILAPASALAEYVATTPFYIECGWAFSYFGNEAQIVTYSDPDNWKRAHRFKMEISGTTRPTGVTITEEEQTYLWGDRYGGPKFPHFIPNGGGQTMLTFDLRSNPPLAGAPPGDYSDAPIYVFYLDGQAEPIVWRLGSAGTQEDETGVVDEIPSGNRYSCGSSDYYEASPGVGAGVFGTYNINYGEPRFYNPDGPLDSPIEDVESWTAAGSFKRYSSVQDGDWFLHNPGSNNRVYSQHWLSYRDSISAADWVRTDVGGFMVPFYDREQVYLFRKVKETLVGANYIRHTSGFGLGTWDMWRLNTSVNGPCTPSIPTPYKPLICGQELPEMFQTSIFHGLFGACDWCSPPMIYNMFGSADGCYGTPDAHDTRVWCYTSGSGATSCPSSGSSMGAYDEIVEEYQKLYAIDHSTGQFVEVKDWEEYEPVDAYTSVIDNIDAGSQVLVSHPDAFTGAGFASAEMNGTQGDEYHFFGNADSFYPLAELTSGMDRGWFGVPF